MFVLKINKIKEEVEIKENIERVSFVSSKGTYEILTNHEPFFSTFLPPHLIFQPKNQPPQKIQFKESGFLEFKDNICCVWII